MKINKKIFFISLVLLILPFPVQAFTNSFNITSDEELVTITGEPGKTYDASVNLETSTPSLTVYPLGFSFPTSSSYSTSSWLSFAESSYAINNSGTTKINFTVTIPTNITAGEYYQAVAFSDIPFVDAESADPATVLAIPITFQVSSTPIEEDSGSSSSSSSSSGSSSSTSSTSQTTTATASPKTKPIPKLPSKPIPQVTKLFSKIVPEFLKTKYSLYNQQTKIDLSLKNEGNISSVFLGSIQVLNQKNNPIKVYSLNPQKDTLRPNKNIDLSFYFSSPHYLIGKFRADLLLGDQQSTQKTFVPSPVKTITFYHFGLYPLIIVGTFLLVFVFAKNKKFKAVFLTVCTLCLLYCYYLSHRPRNFYYLGDQIDVNVSALVKEQIGLKSIINNDLSKTILFTSTNSLGSTLFSLQSGTRNHLDEVLQYTYGSYTANLLYPNDSYPIMMITRGY